MPGMHDMLDPVCRRPTIAPTILGFIRDLAEYEKLLHEVVADEAAVRATLFGLRPAAEVLIAELAATPVGFALFFQTYSTFLAKPGLWLEDLFVRPAARGKGVGAALMAASRARRERDYGASSGACSTGTSRPSRSTHRSARSRMSEWTVQRLTGAR